MKLLLYCTKPKNKNDYLIKNYITHGDELNGKVVCECDFEVEEIRLVKETDDCLIKKLDFETKTLSELELCKKSCLKIMDLIDYLDFYKNTEIYGYAIHIKNLEIFDKPKELSDYVYYCSKELVTTVKKAPQNMRYVYKKDGNWITDKSVLISIHPEHLCKILNRIKTVEVRKKVLKEML